MERRDIIVDQTVVTEYNKTRSKLPPEQKGVAGAALVLSPVLEVSQALLVKKLTGKKRYTTVLKDIEPAVWAEVEAKAIPGLYGVRVSKRIYPNSEVGASMIGFLSKDGRPLAGIEKSRNDILQGTAGSRSYERGANGQPIATGVSSEIAPIPGDDIQLTIDRDLQWQALDALSKQVKATEARSGAAVIMDIKTGDVLALADAPTFDPNDTGKAKASDLTNRALVDVFRARLDQQGDHGGRRHRGGRGLTDHQAQGSVLAEPRRRRVPRLARARDRAADPGRGAGPVQQRGHDQGRREDVQRHPARLPDQVRLRQPDRGRAAGVGRTPHRREEVQQHHAVHGDVRPGRLGHRPAGRQRVRHRGQRRDPEHPPGDQAIGGSDGKMHEQPAGPTTRAISAKTAKKLRLMLESVVSEEGTAIAASIPGYRVAGKTGTADFFDDEVKRYNGYTASFIGIAPAEKPRLVVAVFLQQPKNGHYGGTVAAPVFQELMMKALAREGIAPSGSKAPEVPLTWP